MKYAATITLLVFVLLVFVGLDLEERRGRRAAVERPRGDARIEDLENVRQEQHRRAERRYWRFQNAVGIFTVLAVLAAGASAWFAWNALHESTIAATASLNAANAAHRQADAAENSLPRSWLYVELLGNFPVGIKFYPDRNRFRVTMNLRISLHNYGDIPATISGFTATLFVKEGPVAADEPFGENGVLNPGITRQDGFAPMTDFIGATVAKDKELISLSPLQFDFGADSPYMVASRKWLRVLLAYNDPHGSSRETCYFADVEFSPREIAQPGCNSHK